MLFPHLSVLLCSIPFNDTSKVTRDSRTPRIVNLFHFLASKKENFLRRKINCFSFFSHLRPFRHGGNNVGILQRHHDCILHHPYGLVRGSIWCYLLSHDADEASLAEVSQKHFFCRFFFESLRLCKHKNDRSMRCDGVTAIIAPTRLSKSSPEHEAGGEKQYLTGRGKENEINSFVAGDKKGHSMEPSYRCPFSCSENVK